MIVFRSTDSVIVIVSYMIEVRSDHRLRQRSVFVVSEPSDYRGVVRIRLSVLGTGPGVPEWSSPVQTERFE